MYSEEDLDAAVAAGAVSGEAVAALRAFVARRREAPVVDEEHFRLLTGFNDIFVAIAAILVLLAIGFFESENRVLAGVLIAAASWGMAEYFTRHRRMALPSIVLLIGFVTGVFQAAHSLFGVDAFENPANVEWGMAASAGLTALAALAHWRRFRVPITVAAGAAAALMTAVALLVGLFPGLEEVWVILVFASGVVMFALAMRWDASDRARTTRRGDVAFWLHLAAAPLLVHPLFVTLGLLEGEAGGVSGAVLAVAVYAVLGIVALAIDRRALLVSGLGYVLYAMGTVIEAAGMVSQAFSLTALLVGAALLLLSAAWQAARRAVVIRLPAPLRERLPVVG